MTGQRPPATLMPPPQVFEGSTNFLEPGRRRPWAVLHCSRDGVGAHAARIERWVIYDAAPMREGRAFRAARSTDPRVHQPWPQALPFLLTPPAVGLLEQRVVPKSPPASAEETGETGVLTTYRLFCGRGARALEEAVGLLRIDHGDGTWTDHWALWANWQDVDADCRMEARPIEPGAPGGAASVRAFLENMLIDPKRWGPGVGEWVHTPRARVQPGPPPHSQEQRT